MLVEGLTPATTHEYGVKLDGRDCWPLPDQAPSVIRTLDRARPFRLAFGSCRVVGGHETADRARFGVDALWALAMRMRGQTPDAWPQTLLLLGDQVYADKLPPRTAAFVRARRGDTPPRGEVADFAEYAHLYRESWSDPVIRWLLATLPSAMIFDDHEVHDDWNTSHAWKEDVRRKPWWQERIVGALMAYWVYQHLGNLSPRALADDELFAALRVAPDGTALLHDFAARAERTTAGRRFSYYRDFGAARLVVVDSRAGRVLSNSERDMLDEEEWRWLEQHLVGDIDHLPSGLLTPP